MKPSSLHRFLAASALLVVTFAGCGDLSRSARADRLSRSAFIDAYVDLRVAALRTDDGRLEDTARAEILDRHGVTEDQLLDFVAAHGGDLDFMRDLWNEIEIRLDSVPPIPLDSLPPDTLAANILP